MFDKFGNFNGVEELNEKAAELMVAKDYESIKELTKENGIDIEDAEDYIDGIIDVLATPITAAFGKLDIESAELQPYEIMNDWISYIRITCQENKDMAEAVRQSDKSLRGCIAELLKWSFKNAKPVDGEILKACNINFKVTLGIPGIGTAKKIIKEYYLGGTK